MGDTRLIFFVEDDFWSRLSGTRNRYSPGKVRRTRSATGQLPTG